MKGIMIILLLGMSWALSLHAETRIWTSTKGDSIEAEYVKMFAGKVILKTAEGKQLKVPVSGLCSADKAWLANAIPPKIKITVDTDKDRDTLDSYSSEYGTYNYEKKAETTKCTAVLKQTNKEPSNREFIARMYVIGKQTNRDLREVISYAEHEFSFKSSKTTQFKTAPVTVEYTKSNYAQNRGARYEGFLVLVEDKEGNIVAVESSQTSYEKNAHKFKAAKKGTEFDNDFDIMNPNKRKRN